MAEERPITIQGDTVVRLKGETWERLRSFATPFRGSERGTPDKVIAYLLDLVEAEVLPERIGLPVERREDPTWTLVVEVGEDAETGERATPAEVIERLAEIAVGTREVHFENLVEDRS